MAKTEPILSSLSTELQLQIFKYLDPVHSTCLGLTSKHFYALHCSLHQRIPLDACTYDCPVSGERTSICFLSNHLQNWKPQNLSYCFNCHKFRPRVGVEVWAWRCEKCCHDDAFITRKWMVDWEKCGRRLGEVTSQRPLTFHPSPRDDYRITLAPMNRWDSQAAPVLETWD